MRSNGFTLVRGDEVPLGTLSGEDGEVILPEVDDHLFELPLARHSPAHFGDLHLGQYAAGFLSGAPELDGVLTRHVGTAHLRAYDLRRRVSLEQLPRRERERWQSANDALRGGVADPRGLKLQRDPLVDAHRSHALDVAGPRPERKP